MNNQNNEQFEKFIRDMQNIRMSHDEKNKMREHLESFAYHYDIESVESPYQHIFNMFKKPLAIALAIFLVIGSTKPASASALPGQILYPIKMIHEEIEAATKTTPEKKASFEIKRTENRIQEAIKLAKKEDLSTETQNKIAETIKVHTKKVVLEIEDIKKENPQKALALTSELKTTLKSNSEALKKVKKHTSVKEDIIKNLDEVQETSVHTVEPEKSPITPVVIGLDKKIEIDTSTTVKTNSTTEQDGHIIQENNSVTIQDTKKVADITEKEPALSVVEENDVDILVQSINLEIEITETVEKSVKEDIIKNLDEVQETSVHTVEPEKSPITPVVIGLDKKIEIDTSTTVKTNSTTEQDGHIIQENNSVTIQDTKKVADITEKEPALSVVEENDVDILKGLTVHQITYTKENFISSKERIENEITSLKNIITLKNSLLEMAQDARFTLTQEKELFIDAQVQGFINKGQYGQALIYLQSEIDIITQQIQSQQIQKKFGINITEQEVTSQ